MSMPAPCPVRPGLGPDLLSALSCFGDGRLCSPGQERRPGAMPTAPVMLSYNSQTVYIEAGDPLPDWADESSRSRMSSLWKAEGRLRMAAARPPSASVLGCRPGATSA
jgi:hypothetical protein